MQTSSLKASLAQLQASQYQHDMHAHQDILSLIVPRRVTHFTLHFAKYAGYISKAIRSKDKGLLCRTLTDSVIIGLAAANAMNMDLLDRIQTAHTAVGNKWSKKAKVNCDDLLGDYSELVGNMAKACEALDHLENYPSREVLENSVVELVVLVDRFAQQERLNLPQQIMQRWDQVERKHLPTPDKAATPIMSSPAAA